MNKKNELTSLEILFSISRELATTLDLHTVLERVLSLSTSNIGAERASLIVLGDKGNPINAAIISNGKLTPTTTGKMKDVITSGLAGWVIRNKNTALLNDAENDERWLLRANTNNGISAGKSALCIPVMAHDKLVGVLTIVHPRVNFFTEEHVALQKTIADMAGIAIYNAELYKDVQNAHLRYYDLFEESIDPIFVTNLHGKILEANQQASMVTENKTSELLAMTITDLHELSVEKIGRKFEQIPIKGSVTYESTLKRANNEPLPVEVHVSQIVIADEIFLQWIFKDIQEQKKVDQLRDDLSAMLYHDLRSPLANIISSLDIMSNIIPLSESETLRSVFEVAKRSTERMQRMINGLLDINRLESGQQITNKQISKLSTVIDEAVDVIHSAANNKGISISKVEDQAIPDLLIDAEMIRRVIINLLENAIKFSPNDSIIRIGMNKDSEKVLLWVEDQGHGIPESTKEDIFEKFIRLKQNYPVKGLGLGLAFCKLAVQAHGGTIWVENIPQGGSRFIFSLPLMHHE